ncbi:hypothetical protein BD779DRAFT_1474934 [Infundibulicybe gibba]|nr:hypothetical protein BD779DRAFT_1474934 [Infundibulicybe gibba]
MGSCAPRGSATSDRVSDHGTMRPSPKVLDGRTNRTSSLLLFLEITPASEYVQILEAALCTMCSCTRGEFWRQIFKDGCEALGPTPRVTRSPRALPPPRPKAPAYYSHQRNWNNLNGAPTPRLMAIYEHRESGSNWDATRLRNSINSGEKPTANDSSARRTNVGRWPCCTTRYREPLPSLQDYKTAICFSFGFHHSDINGLRSLGKAKFLLGPWLAPRGQMAAPSLRRWARHFDHLEIDTVLLILNFQDLDIAIGLNYTTWWQSGNPLMVQIYRPLPPRSDSNQQQVATIGLYVQVFFCYRLYAISKENWWVVGPICAVLLFAYLSVIVATYYITVINSPAIATWSGDLAMTTATTVYLLRSKRDVLPQTVGLISALVRLTFRPPLPRLFFYSGEEKLISTAFNQALPKLYAISMMWTLNARRAIRENGSRYPTSEETSGRGRRVVTGQRENVELASFGGVQVRGMFHTSVPQEEDKLASPDQNQWKK